MGGSWERKAPRYHSDSCNGPVRGRKLRRWPTDCCFSILPVGTARHSRTNSLAGELDGDILGTSEESEGVELGTTLGVSDDEGPMLGTSDGKVELDGDILGTSLGIEESEGTKLGSMLGLSDDEGAILGVTATRRA